MSEVKPISVYRHSGYLVNLKNISEEEKERALDMFTYSMYDDKSCNKCPNLEYRHSEVCDNCASFLGHKRLAKDVDMGKEVMLSLPYGATNRVRKWLKSLKRPYKVVDRHPEPTPFRRPIKFTGSLRDYQLEAVAAIFENKKGLIKAPPRSGKTVIGTGFICKNGQKTLILASQREWLIGFQETFLGGENSEALTNARPSQVKFCKTFEDFQNTDVALATFQQFMNPNGRKVLEKIKSLFNVVMVDEVHLGTALETSRILSRFNATFRIGLSGTPEKKVECLFQIVYDLVGPIIYEAKVLRLKPRVELVPTECTKEIKGMGDAAFTNFVTAIERDTKRCRIVAQRIVQAVNQKHMVLLPVMRVKTVDVMVAAINKFAGKRIAAPFYGTMNKDLRKKTIEWAREYKVKVLVGNTKLISVGLNIPRASCIVERFCPSSNVPNCDQRVSRILTPMEGKPNPLILYLLDNSKIMRATAKNEWWKCIHVRHNPLMSGEDRARLMEWLKGKSEYDMGDLKEGL